MPPTGGSDPAGGPLPFLIQRDIEAVDVGAYLEWADDRNAPSTLARTTAAVTIANPNPMNSDSLLRLLLDCRSDGGRAIIMHSRRWTVAPISYGAVGSHSLIWVIKKYIAN